MTRDEFLTKAMGRVWQTHDCSSCSEHNADFTYWEPFVELLLWSQDDARVYVNQGGPEKWTWEAFYAEAWHKYLVAHPRDNMEYYLAWQTRFSRWLFNPERFAGILAEFLGWREP